MFLLKIKIKNFQKNWIKNRNKFQDKVSMDSTDYRSIILQKLKARDRNCAQFKGIFNSCIFFIKFKKIPILKFRRYFIRIIYAFNYKKSDFTLKSNSFFAFLAFKRKRVSFYFIAFIAFFNFRETIVEIDDLKQELADVYKKKAINDQQLLESKEKIGDLQKQLSEINIE